jgi:hypothetical protein
MPDWETVSGRTELGSILQGLPWISNSPDFAARASDLRRKIVTKVEAEVFRLYIRAHILEIGGRCQVRSGIFIFSPAMSFVLFVNVICVVNLEKELQ